MPSAHVHGLEGVQPPAFPRRVLRLPACLQPRNRRGRQRCRLAQRPRRVRSKSPWASPCRYQLRQSRPTSSVRRLNSGEAGTLEACLQPAEPGQRIVIVPSSCSAGAACRTRSSPIGPTVEDRGFQLITCEHHEERILCSISPPEYKSGFASCARRCQNGPWLASPLSGVDRDGALVGQLMPPSREKPGGDEACRQLSPS
jgi:hypothetical protein